MRTDRHMDMAKIIVTKRSFPKAPKKVTVGEAEINCFLRKHSRIKKLP
jgi:hypothetical protein